MSAITSMLPVVWLSDRGRFQLTLVIRAQILTLKSLSVFAGALILV